MERRPHTVAVVDDDSSMLRSVQRLLNANGLAVEVFPSAEMFLGRDPDIRVACVALDIQLPGMSGLELRRRLIATGSRLPVIFITGTDDDAARREAVQLGCVAYLRKPFPPEALVAAVKSALGGLPEG